MESVVTIIPCAGEFSHFFGLQVPFSSNAMLPLNGKPAISWIMDNLKARFIERPIIVSRSNDIQFSNFLNWAYATDQLVNIQVDPGNTILDSLYAAIKGLALSEKSAIRVVLGDTLIYDPYLDDRDYLFIGKRSDSKRWCTVEVDESGKVTNLFEKRIEQGDVHLVAAGYYFLTNGSLFKNCLIDAINQGEKDLSAALLRYMRYIPIYIKECENWYDLGHIDGILAAKRSLLNSRSFNALVINPVLNTITKRSTNNAKLRDELDWYGMLPEELQVLTPRILSKSTNGAEVIIVQEFYGYTTIAELFLYSTIDPEIWKSIFKHLFQLNTEFRKYHSDISVEDAREVYVRKTEQRLALLEQQESFKEILKFEQLVINGVAYQNLISLSSRLFDRLEAECKKIEISIIHGDFCFSNILFDVNSFIVKLIDPRGSFGKKGIYGDARYEIAKLRHSVIGKYDFIVSNLFSINRNQNQIEYSIAENDNCKYVTEVFDQMVIENGYDLNDIKLLEAVLFLSMPPLHSDNFNRQLMMYTMGIIKLNEILCVS